ncbi:MAG: glycosyltransferase family 4 protein [Thermoleophilaceae bacterium]
MRVLVAAVGKRTEHWEGFLSALARSPELELDVLVADVTDLTVRWLEAIAGRHPSRFRYRVARHWIGEERTGHMASIAYAPGAWRDWPRARPDVVHLTSEPSYLSSAQAIFLRDRRWPGVPITHYAAQNVETRFPWPFPALERRAYRRIDHALPITTAALSVLRAKGYEGAARIVPLGVDRRLFAPASSAADGPFTVGFVGRLEPHKGIADLLEAVRDTQSRLLIAGDGSLRPMVEAESRSRPNEVTHIRWTSHRELPALLQRMHVLALPSIEVVQRNVLPWVGVPLREQFGRVLVEAMACGVPCVATRVGEVAEVVAGGGRLVEPGRPDQLGRAFAEIRDDPELAGHLRRAALERAATFDWEHIAAEVHAVWRELTPRGTPSDEFEHAPALRVAG